MNSEPKFQSAENSKNSSLVMEDDSISAADAAVECFKRYARERPEVVTLWAFGIGFVLGWKLKPW